MTHGWEGLGGAATAESRTLPTNGGEAGGLSIGGLRADVASGEVAHAPMSTDDPSAPWQG